MNPRQPYKLDYPGADLIAAHDQEDELRRWFANYCPSRMGAWIEQHEWLTIEERRFEVRGRKRRRYIGTIGSDRHKLTRLVAFDASAPPPPTFFQASEESLRRERERKRKSYQFAEATASTRTSRKSLTANDILDAVRAIEEAVGPLPRYNIPLYSEPKFEPYDLEAMKPRLETLKYISVARSQIDALFGFSVLQVPRGAVVAHEGKPSPPSRPRYRRN